MTTKRIKRAKQLFRAIIFALPLIAAASAYANYTEHRSDDQYGNTYWLSCGSSAGDYFFKCSPDGICQDQGSAGAHQACVDAGYYLQ